MKICDNKLRILFRCPYKQGALLSKNEDTNGIQAGAHYTDKEGIPRSKD